MVAVSPAVDCTLDQTALATKAGVQLCESPADSVAFGLVVQAVALVLLLGAAGARIDAVLGFELLRKRVDIDRLDIASNGVLHLDPVP